MLKLRVLDLFFHWNVFVITQRVKYRKKVPLGTGTDTGTAPVQMWMIPNPNPSRVSAPTNAYYLH